jgi:hypothetical protein
MYTCPYCHQPGITAVQKAFLGPGSQMSCKACGKPVMVRFKPWLLAATPGSLVMVAAYFLIKSTPMMYTVSMIGLVMMIAMHLAWVPLEQE